VKAYKEGKYQVFKFEDGKDVRYNLATGETIGKLGKPVKDICTQLSGRNLLETIDSFEDKRYVNFLKFIDRHFINKSTSSKYHGRVDKIKNVGSFLSRIKDHDYFEQFFACGITSLDPKITYKLNEIPKGLIRLSKEYDLRLGDKLIRGYNRDPNVFMTLLTAEFNSVSPQNVITALVEREKWNNDDNDHFMRLVNEFNYNPKSLMLYIDNLMTYEALDGLSSVLRELVDYCRMMSRISPKYDKYPRNFLTTHRIATRNYNRLKTTFDEIAYQNKVKKHLEYTIDDYKIIYPESTQDIKDEAVQQNHCVASYIDRVIEGTCDILFLRTKDEPEKSLVTLEVRNGKVVQAKGKFNRDVNIVEQDVIDKYNKRLERLEKVC
jgi:hypothetical protein